MKVYQELNLDTFKAWSGAVDTLVKIQDEGKCKDLEFFLEDIYPEGMSETELNDLLWFESEWLFEVLGIEDNEDDDEDN